MNAVFYISGVVAVLASVMVVAGSNAIHALLYLIVSLISVALVFFALGAPFAAAAQVMVYAVAIMVLFAFGIILSGLSPAERDDRLSYRGFRMWAGPVALAAVLLCGLVYAVVNSELAPAVPAVVGPKQVSVSLFSPYLLGLELVSLMLLGALVGAYRLGARGSSNKSDIKDRD